MASKIISVPIDNKVLILFSHTRIMRFSYIKPSVILAPYIKHYWILESEASDGKGCERVIHTGFIEWMFLFQGIPEELVKVENSYTGRFLKPYLK